MPLFIKDKVAGEFFLQQLSLSLSHWNTILSNQLHPTIIFQSQRCAASNTFNFFRRNLKNSAKISGNVFSYTIGGLKASEKENSVLCLYRIGEAAPWPGIRERAKMWENILQWSQGHCSAQRRERLPVWNCRGRKTHSYNDRSCRGKIASLSTAFLYRYRYKFFIFFPTMKPANWNSTYNRYKAA